MRRRIPRIGLALAALLPTFGLAAPTVIAHRGASGYLPEHTLVAKAMAHGMRPDFIEQDVVLTRDGVPVVLHDHYLDTVTDVAAVFPGRHRSDGRYYAIDFDLAEIRRLTVHERVKLATGEAAFPRRFPASTRIPILRVPTLEDEIQLIQGMNASTGRDVGLYVELKSPGFHRAEGRDLARAVLGLLARYGYDSRESNVYVQCFAPATLKRIRYVLRSELKLVQLVGGPTWGHEPGVDFAELLSGEGLRRIARYADGIGPAIVHLVELQPGGPRPTPVLGHARAAGLVIHPYTLRADALLPPIRSIGEACDLLFGVLGVDGVFTDHPDQVREHLRGRTFAGVPPRPAPGGRQSR